VKEPLLALRPLVPAVARLVALPNSPPKNYPRLAQNSQHPGAEIAARFGIARSTLYRTILKSTAWLGQPNPEIVSEYQPN